MLCKHFGYVDYVTMEDCKVVLSLGFVVNFMYAKINHPFWKIIFGKLYSLIVF